MTLAVKTDPFRNWTSSIRASKQKHKTSFLRKEVLAISVNAFVIRIYNTYDEPMIYISVSDEHMTYQSRGSVLFESYVLIFRPALVQI